MSHSVLVFFGDVGLVGYSLQGQRGFAYFFALVILGVVWSAVGLIRSQSCMFCLHCVGSTHAQGAVHSHDSAAY